MNRCRRVIRLNQRGDDRDAEPDSLGVVRGAAGCPPLMTQVAGSRRWWALDRDPRGRQDLGRREVRKSSAEVAVGYAPARGRSRPGRGWHVGLEFEHCAVAEVWWTVIELRARLPRPAAGLEVAHDGGFREAHSFVETAQRRDRKDPDPKPTLDGRFGTSQHASEFAEGEYVRESFQAGKGVLRHERNVLTPCRPTSGVWCSPPYVCRTDADGILLGDHLLTALRSGGCRSRLWLFTTRSRNQERRLPAVGAAWMKRPLASPAGGQDCAIENMAATQQWSADHETETARDSPRKPRGANRWRSGAPIFRRGNRWRSRGRRQRLPDVAAVRGQARRRRAKPRARVRALGRRRLVRRLPRGRRRHRRASGAAGHHGRGRELPRYHHARPGAGRPSRCWRPTAAPSGCSMLGART